MAAKAKVPFPFILDRLLPLQPMVRPMFGCHAVYVGEKIMLVLRQRTDHADANGVWIATSKEHHESLKKEFPSLCSVYLLSEGKAETNWQMIPLEGEDFETEALQVCECILSADPRIGRTPKARPRSDRRRRSSSRKK